MPKRNHKKLPSRLGRCKSCGKDIYPDWIGAELAYDFLSKNPPRGGKEPVRTYPCPVRPETFHLTSTENQDIEESA